MSRGDAIASYVAGLRDALSAMLSIPVELVAYAGTPDARRRARRLLSRAPAGDLIVLHYNPFSFARWGFAPWLLADAFAMRFRSRRPRLAVMVHEAYVPLRGLRWGLMGIWQRLQLWLLVTRADEALITIERWRSGLSPPAFPRRVPVHHIPTGSNLPDRRGDRAAKRRALGADDSTVVLAAFGTADPARLIFYLRHAANRVARAGIPTVMLNLGADAPCIEGLDPSIRLLQPGRLPPQEVAEHLASADLFLAPLADGISTRRSTLMAALQHALPVVATSGSDTVGAFDQLAEAVSMCPATDPGRFADLTLKLAMDEVARANAAAAARELFQRCFDLPVIARKMVYDLRLERWLTDSQGGT